MFSLKTVIPFSRYTDYFHFTYRLDAKGGELSCPRSYSPGGQDKRRGQYLTLSSQAPELNRPGSYGALELEKAVESI